VRAVLHALDRNHRVARRAQLAHPLLAQLLG